MRHLRHEILSDAESFCAKASQTATIKHFQSLVAPRDCLHMMGHIGINAMGLMSYSGTDANFAVRDSPNLHLVASLHGFRSVVTPYGEVWSQPGEVMLLPPGDREATGSHSGVVMTLSPRSLEKVAASMSGDSPEQIQRRLPLEHFQPCLLPCGPQARMLQSLLQFMDRCLDCNPALIQHLAFEDAISRFAVLLLDPALIEREPQDLMRHREFQGKVDFDELIDDIKVNIHKPLRLSDLEARYHYSGRALQYAFRQKLSCTPMQYIRNLRLDAALQCIKASRGTRSIKDIAMECGYLNPSLFAADFKRRHGILPSEAKWGKHRNARS